MEDNHYHKTSLPFAQTRLAMAAIPDRMKHLKITAKGYPIPFFVKLIDGKPEFKYMDREKQELCIERNLCPICGQKNNKDYAYVITGPIGLKNKVVSDPPMHRECAEYSMAVCPHMLYASAERKTDINASIHAKDKPDHLLLIKCSKWRAKFHQRAGYKLTHFSAHSSVKYIYQDNILIRSD